jgi:predicted amidohydrolase YtcJ
MLRVEHASVLTEADIGRFGSLGVTASVQPAFLASEHGWLEARLGTERLQRTYAFRSLLEAGAPLAGGSDCPVEPPHPLAGVATARDRCGLVGEESLTAEEALSLFTTWSGRAIGESAALAPDAPATFTVLDRDPIDADADRLRGTAVVATWIKGEPIRIPDSVTAWRG